ncbi:MAG: winged helix DNA-binding domain-containing protein [Tannerella sp.]|jgi:hypothetical protein|nr:winged helix DNA-binding domain-containing protein [Tannerella sp.]
MMKSGYTKTNIPALRLTGHQLSGSKLKTPGEVVAWAGAVQAQEFGMAKWAIGVRLPDSTEATVVEAFNRGDILRTHVLRPTWHFVTPENIRWMLALSADRIKASARSRDRDLEITETLYSRTGRLIEKALEGNRHLTREDVACVLEKANIRTDPARMTHFLMRAEVEGIVCSGRLQGKTHTYALLDGRAAPAPALHREEALVRLAGIYFTSHSPATLQDFAWWSGLSQTEAQSGLSAVQADLLAEKTNGLTYYRPASTSACTRETPAQAHLLPAFDEYIIAYRDRGAVLPAENYAGVISSNGIFRPVILVNGIVAGLWKRTASRRRPLELNSFTPPDAFAESLIRQAASRYLSFRTETNGEMER